MRREEKRRRRVVDLIGQKLQCKYVPKRESEREKGRVKVVKKEKRKKDKKRVGSK
jgi:hypothetical protein